MDFLSCHSWCRSRDESGRSLSKQQSQLAEAHQALAALQHAADTHNRSHTSLSSDPLSACLPYLPLVASTLLSLCHSISFQDLHVAAELTCMSAFK